MNPRDTSSDKPGFGPKQVVLAFFVVFVAYMAFYHWIEYRRHVKGPWELEFSVAPQGAPVLAIEHPRLDLHCRIRFEGETTPGTNLPLTLSVDRPGLETPFGRIIYEDLTFLPGVVTLDLFGHEIELMPRVLWINRNETPWASSEAEVVLRPEDKPATPPTPPEGGTRE